MAEVPAFELRDGPDYIWAQVAAHLEARIRAGELAPGARIAGEQDLADEYGVAVGTVRRAIQELRDRSLLVTVPSKGTYISGQ